MKRGQEKSNRKKFTFLCVQYSVTWLYLLMSLLLLTSVSEDEESSLVVSDGLCVSYFTSS